MSNEVLYLKEIHSNGVENAIKKITWKQSILLLDDDSSTKDILEREHYCYPSDKLDYEQIVKDNPDYTDVEVVHYDVEQPVTIDETLANLIFELVSGGVI